MNQARSTLISRLNPRVSRRFLFVLAGTLWTVAGAILCVRATIWLNALSLSTEVLFCSISLALAMVAYLFLFARLVERSIERIMALPERVCLFAFTPWRGYAVITLMITLGVTLRSSFPGYYLSIPYYAMGGTLILGGTRFHRRFFGSAT